MTPREVVGNMVTFKNPERLPMSFPEKYGNDFGWVGMNPSPDWRPHGLGEQVDEWGAVWDNIGVCKMGEVKDFPLKFWEDFDRLTIPDIKDPKRWEHLQDAALENGDLFMLSNGISLYERVHFIRGLENTWMDIYEHPDELRKLIGILVDMNLYAIEKYQSVRADGFIFCDDWGLQDKLMISPGKWREVWKPAYARVYKAARDAGMLTFLHSCGYISDILEDLIEIGLDVIQLDQQLNMGLENLHQYSGRITFWCPVDIQAVMCNRPLGEIREYCHKLVRMLGTPEGGFIPKWYGDPAGAGHSEEAVDAMCDEFLKIGSNWQSEFA